MARILIAIVVLMLLSSCSKNEKYELQKYYRDAYSPAAQIMGGTYAGVVETFNSKAACEDMKREVEADDRRIGYDNSMFICDIKGSKKGAHLPRQWSFSSDMNNSGSVTITDVGLWSSWLFYYPGDYLIKLLIEKTPGVSGFFDISTSWYGKKFSGAIGGVLLFFSFLAITGDNE